MRQKHLQEALEAQQCPAQVRPTAALHMTCWGTIQWWFLMQFKQIVQDQKNMAASIQKQHYTCSLHTTWTGVALLQGKKNNNDFLILGYHLTLYNTVTPIYHLSLGKCSLITMLDEDELPQLHSSSSNLHCKQSRILSFFKIKRTFG